MSYTPNNPNVYLTAMSSCFAAVASGQVANGDLIVADYGAASRIADAFGQAVDTAYGSANTPSSFEIAVLAQIVEAMWATRSPNLFPFRFSPGNYTALANSVVAALASALAQVVSEISDPNLGSGTVITTGTGEAVLAAFADNFVPTETGKLLFAAAFGPTASGVFTVDVNLEINSSVANDQVVAEFFLVENLTAITGGHQVAPGIFRLPTSTTPTATGGTILYATGGVAVSGVTGNNCSLHASGIPLTATKGVLAALACFVFSNNQNASQWVVGGTINIQERAFAG